MYTPVPLLVLRADVEALCTLNGSILGECGRARYAALPVADTGTYYVSLYPLSGQGCITRRLEFCEGTLLAAPEGAELCEWPGGVFECAFCTGDAPATPPPSAPECALALRFFSAVQAQNEPEAMACLADALRADFTFAEIAAFLGAYSEARPYFADATGRCVGLLEAQEGRMRARLYTMEYADGKIGNISEG